MGMDVAAARIDYTHIVRLEDVQKHFGAIHALKNINLAIGRNEIVGLIGDNGAGKSTLIKTLTGVLKPSSGHIYIRDRQINLEDYSVGMAHELAIQTVYQDKSLGEKQPLWRNFFVGRQITNRWGFIDIKKRKGDRQRYSEAGNRLPRQGHHGRFERQAIVRRRAPRHRHRPRHAFQSRSHRARRADGGAGGEGSAQGPRFRAPTSRNRDMPASISSTILPMCMRWPTGSWFSTAARSSSEIRPQDMTVAALTEYLIEMQNRT